MDSDYLGGNGTPPDQGKRTAPLRQPRLPQPTPAGFLKPRLAAWAPREPLGRPRSSLALADTFQERPHPCVWAAEIGGVVVGGIGLLPLGEHSASIPWLHIEPDWQHTAILGKLLRQLHEYCQSQAYWRVTMNPQIAPPWIWRLLVRSGFRLLRRVRGPHGALLEFALEPSPPTERLS